MSHGKKIVSGILFTLIFLLIVIYFGFSFYYKDHFYFGSYINNIDYSGKTVEEVENSIAGEIDDYQITLNGRNNQQDTITAGDIGYHYVSNGQIATLKEAQNPFAWPLSLFTADMHEMEVECAYDEEMLKEAVEDLTFFREETILLPEDAYIEEGNDGGYQIIDEVEGAALQKKKTYRTIKNAIDSSETELNLDEKNCYRTPAVRASDEKIQKACKKMNLYTSLTITYDFGDRTEVLEGAAIRDWITLTDDFKVKLNPDKVTEYVNYLGYYYTTFGSTRDFVRHDGKTIQVKGGDYGWVINRAKEAEELAKAIKKGKSVTREPVYSQTAVSRNKNDIGDTYIEVSIKKQHVWLFVNGEEIMDTAVVTGNSSRDYDTPTGIYAITYKEREATLTGENYSSPVNYWMPFNHNIGFHDASWRNKFGKKIYQTSGSHGCINMPLKKAKLLYEHIEKGTPVVVY